MSATEPTVAEASPAALAIIAAEVIAPYTLALTFATGERQTVDFGPFLRQARHTAIRAYLDETRFRQFKLVQGNVNWNDYDLIFPVVDLLNGTIR